MAHRFFGMPTLGGWLTIVNCGFFAALFSLSQFLPSVMDKLGPAFIVLPLIVFSLPLAIFVLLPGLDYSPTLFDIFAEAIVVGVNALIWGYGLSFFIHWARRRLE